MRVVLVHPEIPQNTGTIARTCAATNTELHLIHPMKFQIDEKKVRRAGLDYWPLVQLFEHESWQAFADSTGQPRCWLLSAFGTRHYYTADFAINDALVFGSESEGLSKEFVSQFPDSQLLTIPMANKGVRSLNLSNAATLVLYEARRQLALDDHTTPRVV